MTKKFSIVFFLTMFLIGTDTFLISPLLPTLSRIYGISTDISGWMVSAYAIGYAVFALFSGPISDGRDRKKVMIMGLIAFCISTFLCGFAFNFWKMLLFRLLAGISASFVTPQVWASIPVVVQSKDIVKVMGYATAGLSVAQLIGIPIGSYLAVISWRMPFFIVSLFTVILLLVLIYVLPELEVAHRERLSFFKTYQNVLSNKLSIQYLIAYFVFQTGSFACMTFISTWFTNDFGFTLSDVGTAMIAIGAGNLIGSIFGSRIVNKLGIERSFLYELMGLAILYLLIPFAQNVWLAEILLTLVFLFNGFIFPLFMTTLQSTTNDARSTISSLSNAAMYLGETLAGVIGGLLIKQFSGFSGISIFALIMVLISMGLYAKSGIFKNKKTI